MIDTPEALVKAVRRKTRKKHEPEEKIRIVLEGTDKLIMNLPVFDAWLIQNYISATDSRPKSFSMPYGCIIDSI